MNEIKDEVLSGLKVLVALAKADGVVHDNERLAIENALAGVELPDDASAESLLATDVDLDAELSTIKNPRVKQQTFDSACAIVYVDGEASAVERGMLEIDTGRCNYLWLSQPAQRAVRAGDRFRLRILHFDLTAAEPARAHLALVFGDEVIAEREVDIPQAAQAVELTGTLDRALARGDRVGLHLHNHGQNTWLLADVQVRRGP